ncbi:MAG: hypothetical protein PUK80_03315 [Firmicutes bacterium]|nr:hypothetical protein [Bacillota bacterium]
MKSLNKIVSLFTYSIIIYSIVTTTISQSLWLDMRVHSTYICYGIFLLMLILIVSKDINDRKFLITLDILFLFPVFMGKLNRIAYEIRDAFYLVISVKYFKFILIAIILVDNFLTFSTKEKSL